jgi:hypothetical protein
VTLGEFLFRQLRTHELQREPQVNGWLSLPARRRKEYEEAAVALIEENEERTRKPKQSADCLCGRCE